MSTPLRGQVVLVFTPEFTYSIGVNGNEDFIAHHDDGRRYHLDKDDLIEHVRDWQDNPDAPIWEENAVECEHDALCYGFYTEWQDGLMDGKLVQGVNGRSVP